MECVLIKIYCEYRCGNCLGFCFDILSAQRCWWGCKLHVRDIWREDSQNRRATAVFANVYNWKTSRCGEYLPVIFLVLYFIGTALLGMFYE